MNNEFISKDVFDAKVETLRVMNETLNQRIDDLKDELAEARNSIVRGWTIVGVVGTIGALFLALKGV